ncbi:MAG: GvpL/GvpF family gas vesicle protein [Acidobacteriota bacterium]|nr:GvpL/GvpF family gas vesicle protein [Acidobacteriota bacterium]
MKFVLYVYAVTREAVTPDAVGVDGTPRFGVANDDDIHAVFTPVSAEEFSQDVIDRRAGDLEWLGAIGYRHQAVMADLMKKTAIVPLRAFTLFSSEEALRAYLAEQRALLSKTLDRIGGKQEWTLRIELEPAVWSEALNGRVASLRDLQNEIAAASPGRAFLLRKKLDDEKKRASHAAEEELVGEIEQAVLAKLGRETVAESRQRRDGAFPQINVLLHRDEESVLQELREELAARYQHEGVTLSVSGPWPPYTFATMS